MTINPLDHIPKKPFIFSKGDPISFQLQKIFESIHEKHKEEKIILPPPEDAVHTSDVSLGKWYELDDTVFEDKKPIKINKKSKKSYNVKILGNIYDNKPT